jgi:cyclophilin family peptidyl-prolyl cis-trans isomerase
VPSEKRQRQRENSLARQQALAAAEAQSKRRRQGITVAVIAVAIVALLFIFGPLGGSDDDSKDSAAAPGTTTTSTALKRAGDPETCPPAGGTSKRFTTFTAAPKMCIDPTKTYTAEIKTDVGTITVELSADAAPKTVNNFVFLARNHYYDGVTFHRVIPDFMDQTGDPDGSGTGAAGTFPGYTFEDEIAEGYVYTEGDIAMANSGPNTNGSQFFLVASDRGAQTLIAAVDDKKPHYTPFGHVTKGLSIVKKINNDGSGAGKPNKLHRMISVKITEE